MENILKVENLSVLIKERFLVKNASFSLQKGECIALVGEDKSGKTSLIKAISGSLPVSEGNILIGGEDALLNKNLLTEIGVCLDPPVFFKYQSVMDNLRYLTRLSSKISNAEILKSLESVGLSHRKKVKVVFLSYYEKKLMALALAFLNQPKILLLDEPFKNLKEEVVKTVKAHLRQLQKNGTAVVISTRKVENVQDICTRLIFMHNREIKEVITNKDTDKYLSDEELAFVAVKYPHYCGKMLIDELGLSVKLLKNKIVFEGDESLTAKVVKFITQKQIAIYGAGFVNNQAERILARLTPYFKEEE